MIAGIFNTPIDFTDEWARHPSETGINAWKVLNAHQRAGWACIDCSEEGVTMRPVGFCDEGQLLCCLECYIARLKDHIEWYRPQS